MRRLSEELRELGGDITSALEEILVPATLLDGDGVIRWQNRAAVVLRGRRVGSPFAEFVAATEQTRIRSVIARVLREGAPAEFTAHIEDAEGQPLATRTSAAPVHAGNGVVAVFGLGYSAERKPSPTPRSNAELTNRQVEILRLLAEGRSTDDIASHLSLSPATVRNHIANLIAALGVHSRLQAVVAASNAGLLDP